MPPVTLRGRNWWIDGRSALAAYLLFCALVCAVLATVAETWDVAKALAVAALAGIAVWRFPRRETMQYDPASRTLRMESGWPIAYSRVEHDVGSYTCVLLRESGGRAWLEPSPHEVLLYREGVWTPLMRSLTREKADHAASALSLIFGLPLVRLDELSRQSPQVKSSGKVQFASRASAAAAVRRALDDARLRRPFPAGASALIVLGHLVVAAGMLLAGWNVAEAYLLLWLEIAVLTGFLMLRTLLEEGPGHLWPDPDAAGNIGAVVAFCAVALFFAFPYVLAPLAGGAAPADAEALLRALRVFIDGGESWLPATALVGGYAFAFLRTRRLPAQDVEAQARLSDEALRLMAFFALATLAGPFVYFFAAGSPTAWLGLTVAGRLLGEVYLLYEAHHPHLHDIDMLAAAAAQGTDVQ